MTLLKIILEYDDFILIQEDRETQEYRVNTNWIDESNKDEVVTEFNTLTEALEGFIYEEYECYEIRKIETDQRDRAIELLEASKYQYKELLLLLLQQKAEFLSSKNLVQLDGFNIQKKEIYSDTHLKIIEFDNYSLKGKKRKSYYGEYGEGGENIGEGLLDYWEEREGINEIEYKILQTQQSEKYIISSIEEVDTQEKQKDLEECMLYRKNLEKYLEYLRKSQS